MDLNKAKTKEQYNAILEENKEKNEVCPKCGGLNFTTTFSFRNMSEGFVDLNDGICFDCKNKHSIDQRISKQQYINKIKKII
jgi:hypothetical protein